MPRPETQLDPHAGVVQLFAHDLRLLREKAGCPPYRTLALRAHYAPATLARAAGGRELPSLAVTLAYVRACEGDEEQWEDRWHETAAALTPETHVQPEQHPPATPEEPAQRVEPDEIVRPRIRRGRLIAILAALFLLAGTTAAIVTSGNNPPQRWKPPAGKAEMIDIRTAADGTVRAWSNTGGFPGWPWSDPVGMVLNEGDPALARFADLDGDGFDELVRIAADGTITAWLNDKGFPHRPWHASVVVGKGSTADPADIHFADLDGDGRDELIHIAEVVRAWPNTGDFPKWPWSDPVDLGPAPPRHTRFADLDGDAKAELITLGTAAGTRIQARRNIGAFPAPPWSTAVDLGLNHADPTCVRFADLDGDGFDELISINTDGTTSAWWNNHTFPDRPWHTSVMIGKGWVGDPVSVQFADLTGHDQPDGYTR
ncbi:FG-GAP repeat domain-containing protein [Saccharothrix sp. NRRL B-16314]|uniref:FG-GAP repeat domain-containing protein n=1 Tax=Saccharothrix sp. NRRL B-16314 TaxID=1463825 RepID=UPI0012DDDC69